jgi:hypothetical protein
MSLQDKNVDPWVSEFPALKYFPYGSRDFP